MSKKKPNQTVAERIRSHYQAEGGEWIIERGRQREAALLREACLEIERQAAMISKFETKEWDIWRKNDDLKEKLEAPLMEEIKFLREELRNTREELKKREKLMTKIASEITWELKIVG